jgi:hypothetical protein
MCGDFCAVKLWRPLQLHHVFCLQTLLALNRFKADSIVFREGLEATPLNSRMVYEHVGTVVLGYETITLLVVEPFYCSFWQPIHLLL